MQIANDMKGKPYAMDGSSMSCYHITSLCKFKLTEPGMNLAAKFGDWVWKE